MVYPYQGRNFFEEPERYRYAKCNDKNYLLRWREYRLKTIDELKRRALDARQDKISKSHPSNDEGNTIELHTYLTKILSDLNGALENNDQIKEKLNPFAVKFEVFKRLYSRYDSNLRKLESSDPADLETYILFAKCLGTAAEKLFALNYLSTFLKICDALSSVESDEFSSREAKDLISVLELENRLIEKLAGEP